jgi:hypothetical protein
MLLLLSCGLLLRSLHRVCCQRLVIQAVVIYSDKVICYFCAASQCRLVLLLLLLQPQLIPFARCITLALFLLCCCSCFAALVALLLVLLVLRHQLPHHCILARRHIANQEWVDPAARQPTRMARMSAQLHQSRNTNSSGSL